MGGGDPRDLGSSADPASASLLAARCLAAEDDAVAFIGRRPRDAGGAASAEGEESESLTYAALRSLVSARRSELERAGVSPRDFVVVACGETRATLVSILATWQCGAVVVPVDPHAPPRSKERIEARVRGRKSDDARAALLLFTSGSSGEPKGVLLGAPGLLHNVEAILEYLPVVAAARIGLSSPLFYSYGLLGQAVTTLAAGATLVDLVSMPSAAEQIELARRADVRGISSVPTHLRKLAFLLEEKKETLPLLFCGVAGASLDAATFALLSRTFAGCEFFHQYGLTEASPRVTAISNRDERFASGSAGKPLRGMRLEIRGEDGHAVSPGTEGDLHVHSPSVMLGYEGDATATEAAIGADGFLCTGDRGHVDAEGYLFLAGRSDGVVKCGGERVGLESVAAVIRTLPGVREAAVVGVPHPELGHALVAFVEPELPIAPLRAELRTLLSPAQRPSRVIALAALPRTPNGKLALSAMKDLAQA